MATNTATPGAPDLKKLLKPFFNPPREPVLVDVPELGYLMVDGSGAPEETATQPSTEFQQAFQAIFPVAYTMKFSLKRDGLMLPIMPLEALWWTAPDQSFDMNVPPETWGWRVLMIMADVVTQPVFDAALAEVKRKKGSSDALDRLRFERWREGRCAQIMHIGPYARGAPHDRAAPCLHRRAGSAAARRAPRDLPGRSAPGRSGEAEDGPAAAGGVAAPGSGAAGERGPDSPLPTSPGSGGPLP